MNWEIKSYFKSFNGLRSGWPLSLFLFVVAMDSFSCSLELEIYFWLYNPFSHRISSISHLLFTDKLLVVGHVDFESAIALKHSLDFLFAYMRLEHNSKKSFIFFTKYAKTFELFCTLLNIKVYKFPLLYLGIMLIVGDFKSSHLLSSLTKFLLV